MCSRDPRGAMSSYAEFLREAREMSAIDDKEQRFPVAVPHSRRRGTWTEWMKEVTVSPEVLDSLMKRYDSKSWSATGGRNISVPIKHGDVSSSSRPAEGAWQMKPVLSQVEVPQTRRGEPKEGGATAMRGVSGATRPRTSGRARALRLRSKSFLDEQRPPSEVSYSMYVSSDVTQRARFVAVSEFWTSLLHTRDQLPI